MGGLLLVATLGSISPVMLTPRNEGLVPASVQRPFICMETDHSLSSPSY